MKTGMGFLNISPRDFWDMTPTEFWAVYNTRVKKGPRPMSRSEFEELMRKVPD